MWSLILKYFSQFGDNLQILLCACVYLFFKGISTMISIHSFNLRALTSISEDIPYYFLTIYELYCTYQATKSLLVPNLFFPILTIFAFLCAHVACTGFFSDPASTGSIRHRGSFYQLLTEAHACECEMTTHTHLSTEACQVITSSGIFPL